MEGEERRRRILFFIFDLGHGGAERVLVQLVNALDSAKYDITVQTVFNAGVNKDCFNPNVKRKWLFRRPFHGMKYLIRVFPPRLLHNLLIKEHYDYEIAYLEGIPTRVISGCHDDNTKTFAWVHIQMESKEKFFSTYRSVNEAHDIYRRFHKIAFVSDVARTSFFQKTGWDDLASGVVHNTIDVEQIRLLSGERIPINLDHHVINFCSVGRLVHQKGYIRLMRVLGSLYNNEYTNWHFYLLGEGEDKKEIEEQIDRLGLKNHVTLLGYQNNPHKFVAKMDMFICSSYKEGYSTAVTESVIVGTPVLTTECAGMEEILGEDAGIIVSNDDGSLQEAIESVLSERAMINVFKSKTVERSKRFSKDATLKEFESFILE